MNKILNLVVWVAIGGTLADSGADLTTVHFWVVMALVFCAQAIALFWEELA